MKKTTNFKHRILYLLLCIVFFSSFVSLLPIIKVKADTSFTFNVTTPVNNVYINGPNVYFSGTYTLDSSLSGSSLSVTVTDNTDPANPVTLPSTNVFINTQDNSWSFNDHFTAGLHKLTFIGTDGTTTISKDISFTVDATRPTVSSIHLVSDYSENGVVWGNSIIEDMTHVPIDAKIQLTVKTAIPLTYTKSSDGTSYNNPITVTSASGQTVTSKEDGSAPPQADSSGNYVITFTPTAQLQPNTTYYVNVTKNITDQNGNPIYPVTVKFTTTSNNHAENPHGKYFTNNDNSRANLCSTCHSTHKGATSGLLGGHYIKDPKQSPTDANTINYCMACHDGTSAPKTNGMNSSGSVHDQQIDSKHLAYEGSCSSCHDPHEIWSQNDPNLFKGHYTYTHTGPGEPTGVIDSFTQPCESCHNYPTSTDGTKTYYSAKDAKAQPGVKFNFLHYRENATRVGNTNNHLLEDTDLCLSCHNATKKQQNQVNSDIQTYYSDTNSKHHFASLDGSNITGQLPCSECHDSHGSSNSLLLKSTLGHDYQSGTFSITGVTTLTPAQEREFCLKCHNGSTEIYGVTGKAPDIKIAGHEKVNQQDQQNLPACSSCHGGTTGTDQDKALRAAHDPTDAPQ
jgi:hypothetical protein